MDQDIPISDGLNNSSGPAKRSLPIINTCSSISSTTRFGALSSCCPMLFPSACPCPFVLVFPAGGGDAGRIIASGPDRMYPVREVEFGVKSGRTYSCTIGLLRGFFLEAWSALVLQLQIMGSEEHCPHSTPLTCTNPIPLSSPY